MIVASGPLPRAASRPDRCRSEGTILSQRDLFHGSLARALGYGEHAQRKVLDTLVVKEVMTSDVVATSPDTPLAEAARVMLEKKSAVCPWSRGAGSWGSSRRRTSLR